MKIEICLMIDERKQKPYWDARLKHGDKVIMEVVSQTIDRKEFASFKDNWERVCNRMLKEIVKRPDRSEIIKHLINEKNN